MSDVEQIARERYLIVRALNEAWDNCTADKQVAILLVASKLAQSFRFRIVYVPGKGFET